MFCPESVRTALTGGEDVGSGSWPLLSQQIWKKRKGKGGAQMASLALFILPTRRDDAVDIPQLVSLEAPTQTHPKWAEPMGQGQLNPVMPKQLFRLCVSHSTGQTLKHLSWWEGRKLLKTAGVIVQVSMKYLKKDASK